MREKEVVLELVQKYGLERTRELARLERRAEGTILGWLKP
jgi:hypothetical protein